MFDEMSLSDLSVLADMVEEWDHKNRHGELVREYRYSEDDLASLDRIRYGLRKAQKSKGLV